MALKILVKNVTNLQISGNIGLNVSNVVLDMLNIFAITFYQPSITIIEILAKNVKEITNRGQ